MNTKIERRFLTFYNENAVATEQYEITKIGTQYWQTYTDKAMFHWIRFMEIDGTEHKKRIEGLRWTFGVKLETLH